MIDKISKLEPSGNERPLILVAPTWKSYSLLNRFRIEFFQHLLKDDSYDVVLRPHPQTFISFPDVIKEIETTFADCSRFTIDIDPSGETSMAASSLLISDLSGIIWDYVFLFSKPVLLIDTPLDLDGCEATDLDSDIWEIAARNKVGKVIYENEIKDISEYVNNLLINNSFNDIEKFRNESVYNFGNARKIAAEKILEIVTTLKYRQVNL